MRNSGSTVGRIVEITLGSRWIRVGFKVNDGASPSCLAITVRQYLDVW